MAPVPRLARCLWWGVRKCVSLPSPAGQICEVLGGVNKLTAVGCRKLRWWRDVFQIQEGQVFLLCERAFFIDSTADSSDPHGDIQGRFIAETWTKVPTTNHTCSVCCMASIRGTEVDGRLSHPSITSHCMGCLWMALRAGEINEKQNVSEKPDGEACGGYKGYVV